MVFAWTTLGFAALDLARARLKLANTWDPRSLPKVVRPADRLSRVRSMCEAVLGTACTVWLLLLPWAPSLFLGPAAAVVEPTSIWRLVYVPIVLLTATGAVHSLVNFMRPYRTPARSLVRAAVHGGNLLVAAFLLRSGDVVAAKAGATLPGNVPLPQVADMVNFGFRIGFLVVCIVSLIEIVREVYPCAVGAVDIFGRFGARATRERRIGVVCVADTPNAGSSSFITWTARRAGHPCALRRGSPADVSREAVLALCCEPRRSAEIFRFGLLLVMRHRQDVGAAESMAALSPA